MTPHVDERLQGFLQTTLGPFEIIRFYGWQHAESNVWRVSAGEKRYFLKQHAQPRKFQQEVYAYQNWTPQLTLTPDLISIHKDLNALLLSAVPGELAQEVTLSELEEREVYRRAGAFLRRLHDLPFEDTDNLPLTDALLMRSESWLKRAKGLLDEQTIQWVSAQLDEVAQVVRESGWTRVPCHRDYTARNWLLDGDTLHVIDFEHAKPDLFLADFEKLQSLVWWHRSNLRDAFFEGYGRSLTDDEAGVLERLALHGALVMVVWACEHDDKAFERQGREVLGRIRG